MKNLIYFDEVAYFSIGETINSVFVFSRPLPLPTRTKSSFLNNVHVNDTKLKTLSVPSTSVGQFPPQLPIYLRKLLYKPA